MKIHAIKYLPESPQAKRVLTFCGWHMTENSEVVINNVTCKMCLLNMKKQADYDLKQVATNLGFINQQLETLAQ